MTGGSHLVVGLAGWLLVAHHAGLPAANGAALAACAAGALLPDLDHPASRLGRRVPAIAGLLHRMCGHRGFTHSLCAACFVLFATARLHAGKAVTLALATGLLSHLLADGLTPAGVPLFWPARRRLALPLCRTGSWREVVVVGAIVGLAWFGLNRSR